MRSLRVPVRGYDLLVGARGGGRGALVFVQQLRQLGDIHRNPPRLVLGEELGRRPPVRLIGIIDVGKLLSVRVAYDVVVRLQLGIPRGQEAAGGEHQISAA